MSAPCVRFESVPALAESLRPPHPVFCIRPRVIAELAHRFQEIFPGTVLYAVKCNPHPVVMKALYEGGIRHFDVASLPEIEQVRRFHPEAGVYFMHPVKDRVAIRDAYHVHGVRHFAVDHPDELNKVLEETGGKDLFIFVRVRTPEAADVLYHLAAKFGARAEDAADLVREAERQSCQTGLTFHVGSQCLDPVAYRVAMEILGEVVERSGREPACIDVGGGFPEAYPDVEAPPLEAYVEEIVEGLRQIGLDGRTALWAEPGRALVASGCSVLAHVKLRKEDQLYINDGVYGAFSELIDSEQELLARRVWPRRPHEEEPQEFVVHGPTCDSMDVLASKLRLPKNTREGDWIEVDQLGAYSSALSTRFNGFGLESFAEVDDEPIASAANRGLCANALDIDTS